MLHCPSKLPIRPSFHVSFFLFWGKRSMFQSDAGTSTLTAEVWPQQWGEAMSNGNCNKALATVPEDEGRVCRGAKVGQERQQKRGRKKQWCSGIKVKSQQKNSSGNMFLCDLETCEQHYFVLIMFRFMFRCYLTPIFLISMFAVALFKLSHSMSHIHFFFVPFTSPLSHCVHSLTCSGVLL